MLFFLIFFVCLFCLFLGLFVWFALVWGLFFWFVFFGLFLWDPSCLVWGFSFCCLAGGGGGWDFFLPVSSTFCSHDFIICNSAYFLSSSVYAFMACEKWQTRPTCEIKGFWSIKQVLISSNRNSHSFAYPLRLDFWDIFKVFPWYLACGHHIQK